jgi:hypothetical protein
MKKIKDLTGLRVGRLLVLEYAGKTNGSRPRCCWKCICDCGNKKIVSTDALSAGVTKSCGCLKSPTSKEYHEQLQKRLLKHCKVENQCWIWKSLTRFYGYGHTTIRNRSIAAHRAAWIAWKSDIPEGLFVLHKCDNPACINPEHLFLGNQLDNMHDMIKKNRENYAKGENSATSLLNNEQIKEIRRLKGVESSYKICERFGVAASTIRSIWSGRNWKHVV